jgi:membrane protein YdbS with pleckstrin-like domain
MHKEPIDPSGLAWSRAAPAYRNVRMLGWAAGTVAVLAACSIPVVLQLAGALDALPQWLPWLPLAVAAAIQLWRGLLIPRQVRALGYAERDDDLLIRNGVLFQRVLVVPYGRMQYVDLAVGPVERMFGLCTLRLHTAAAGTSALIPGLPAAEGARLREQLSARGEARLAGL